MQITLIVKATRLCNLRCHYCHDWRVGKDQTMPFDVLARLIHKTLQAPEHRKVTFIWHGGETTLLPIEFYEKALLLQHRFRRPGQQIENLIQTNATRLSDEWVTFLRKREFGVGVSIDGPPQIHNQTRIYAGGRESWDDVYEGILKLRQYEIPHSVLMVIGEPALALGAKPIFEFMVNHGIKKFGLLASKPTNQPDAARNTPTSHYVNPTRMNRFLMEMYDIWQAHDDPEVTIRELDVLAMRMRGGEGRPCTLVGGCLGHFFLVEPNGDVAHCDLFLGDPAYTLGNIVTDDFATIRRGDAMRALQADNQMRLAQMSANCPEFNVCNGWCPHERYLSIRHNPDHSDNCCGLRPLIQHMRGPETDTISLPVHNHAEPVGVH